MHRPAGCEHARPGAGPLRRRPIPPFTEEHEEFRTAVRRFVETELRPTRASGRRRAGSRTTCSRACRARLHRAQVPAGVRRRRRSGRRRGVRRGARAVRLGRPGRRDRRARRDRAAADLEVRHRGAEAALPRPGDPRREDRGARDHRARRGLRRRVDPHSRAEVDGGYVVNGSKTFITGGVRADVLVTAVKTTAGGRPPRASRS